jgi:rhodanese-related sulfurtransferase
MVIVRSPAAKPMAGTAQFLGEARRLVRELSPTEAQSLIGSGEVDVVVDVREPEEWKAGHMPGAVHAPRGMLEWHADPLSPLGQATITESRHGRVVVVCATGARSLLAARTLLQMGYTNVASMRGGYRQWLALGLPSAKDGRPSKYRLLHAPADSRHGAGEREGA